MKRIVTVAAAVTLALLTSCSSGNSDSGKASAAKREVHEAGDRTVSVPAHPRRIVALSEPTLDGALALGVTPVGTTSGRGQSGVSHYLAGRAAGIPIVATVAGPNLEKISTLHPDLILIDGTVMTSVQVRDKLAGIATTVMVSKTGEDWKSAFTREAHILDRADEGKRVLNSYADSVSRARAHIPQGATVSIVRWAGAPQVLLSELPASRIVADLGLKRPAPQAKTGPGHSVPVSLENIDQIDADWMFFGALPGGGPGGGSSTKTAAGVAGSRQILTAAEKAPGFTNLGAYRKHHIVPVDGSAWTSAGGPLAAQVIVHDVRAALGTG